MILFACVCVTVFFNFFIAKVIHQSPCQSHAHAAALDMKKLVHMDTHTVHTEPHKYTLMPGLGIMLIT